MKASKVKTYRCRNRTTCEFGKSRKEISIGEGHKFSCPLAVADCERKNLTELVRASGGPQKKLILLVLAIILGGGGIWFLVSSLPSSKAPEATVEEALKDVWPWLK